MAKTVKVEDFPKVFKEYATKLGEEFNKIVSEQVVEAVPRLVEASPVDTGEYAASWDSEASKEAVRLGNFAPHASVIEFGARPFKPPLGPLLAWAKRVLQDSSQPPDYSPEVWKLAIGTQRKIEREGMEPRNILANELPNIVEEIKRQAEHLDEVRP